MSTKSPAPDPAQEGWQQSSTCRAVEAVGRSAGREYGMSEAMSQELVRLLSRQAKQRFGSLDTAGRATLDALCQAFARDQLLDLADRILTTGSWSDWLAGVIVPPPAPGLPEYTKDREIDLEPSGPSIDTYARASMLGGSEVIVHIRIQKWYQPDLDRHLFEQSRKLERKHGKLPMVLVFLLWPPAEGPGMTGKYKEVDAKGKVKRVFRYTIRRAWELAPEEVVHSPGTMLLAPLTKGSKERMPEIVGMVKKELEQNKVDAKTWDMVWGAFYWSMGLICDLDEAHRALGDMLPVIHNSCNYLSAKGHAFMTGYCTTQTEGPLTAARALILRQAARRFGDLPGAAEKLEAITTHVELEAMAQRVLTATDWQDLFARSWSASV
jgi:hypothetical protein